MAHRQTIIIAEAGVNHNGDIRMAKQLVDVAAEAGVDYIKFQTFKADKLVSPSAIKASYQSMNLRDDDNTQFKMLKNLELSHENHLELVDYCNRKKINFFSTAFDVESVQYLNELGLNIFKSPSGELTNYPYLRALAKTGKPIILSTGMARLGEIEAAIIALEDNGCNREKVTVLHCNTEYPTPMEDVNLNAMKMIGRALGVKIGYSDHTIGIEVPIAAVSLGATIIEKHFTLNRNLPGPDHKASLEPDELKAMVKAIHNIELAISGNGRKEPSKSELHNKEIARKSIHLAKSMKKGNTLTEESIISLRPGNGISPMQWNNIIGRRLTIDKKANEMLNWADIS